MNRNTFLRRLAGRSRSDEGMGLVLVVGTMMLLASLTMVALGYAMSSKQFARYDQDYSAAMTAAQSGVEDFVSRLNRDYTYAESLDCTNLAWQGPMTTTNICNWTATTPVGWLPVTPSETDPDAPHFHYAVNAAAKTTQGTIGLVVTGRVNGVYRTIETTVGKGGSTDFVYYTDFESADPQNIQAYTQTKKDSMSAAEKDACGINGYTSALYWWEGRSSRNCSEIQFTGGDELDGEVFTNDTIYAVPSGTPLKAPSFKKQVYTSDQKCKNAGATTASWNTYCLRSGSSANFNGYKPIAADEPLHLDDTSEAFAGFPGCHYYGATRVVFHSNGTMTVWNKKSVNGGTPPVAIAPPAESAPSCGDLDALDSDGGATIDVPTEMVIYAATAPSSVPTRQCYAGEIGGPTADRRLPLGTFTSSIPATPGSSSPSYDTDANMTEPSKACSRGNLYAEGVLKGRVTLAAAESVIVTGDLVLAGGPNGSDMLGLVATNSVEVFHPRMVTYTSQQRRANCGSNTGSGRTWQYCLSTDGSGNMTGNEKESHETPYGYGVWPTRYDDPADGNTPNPNSGIQIAGSIQTLQHSFWVQKYNKGSGKGTLLVNGSIAQRWRGIVGTAGGASGYIKDYNYDTRLQYSTPPYFPKWAKAQWSLRYSGEISTPDGTRS